MVVDDCEFVAEVLGFVGGDVCVEEGLGEELACLDAVVFRDQAPGGVELKTDAGGVVVGLGLGLRLG